MKFLELFIFINYFQILYMGLLVLESTNVGNCGNQLMFVDNMWKQKQFLAQSLDFNLIFTAIYNLVIVFMPLLLLLALEMFKFVVYYSVRLIPA